MTGPLDDWKRSTLALDGTSRQVFRLGAGPGVVVVHEIPGITPEVEQFARRVVDAGFTVVMPSLFGTPGKSKSGAYEATQLVRACISREFVTLHTGRTSPITRYLRAVAADLHRDVGGPGVGAVGMCLTGGFVLAMVLEAAVIAPVLSQPALPFPVSARHRCDVNLSAADAEAVRGRVEAEDLCVLGLRFDGDPGSPQQRFDRLAELLGDRFDPVTVPTGEGTPFKRGKSHSVLTHRFTTPGASERREQDVHRVIEFLQSRLNSSA